TFAVLTLASYPYLPARETCNQTYYEQSFTILQIPDMHYTGNSSHFCRGAPRDPCSESNMTIFLNTLLDQVKPDFIVYTGDQVENQENQDQVKTAIDAYSAPAIARRIPWAMVFGNHDEGDSMNRKEMLDYIAQKPYSHTHFGPADIGGVGNYEIDIKDHANTSVFRMYFIDTGNSGGVSVGQNQYLQQLAASHEAVPAVLFAHIPIPEYILSENETLKYGHQGERVSAGPQSGLFDTLVKMGDVKAMFVGHDHDNNYCVERSRIQLCYGGGSGYGAAYNLAKAPRNARVIQWQRDSNGPSISTWMQVDNDYTKNEYPLFGYKKDCLSSFKESQPRKSTANSNQYITVLAFFITLFVLLH
ncbi:hypothetical protein THRCLA_07049, partial [Thraustotheca clavata]